MKIQLQTSVPYPQSRKWEIHTQHYLQAGHEIWLKREVPSNVTTNPRFAWQQAMLLWQTLQQAQWPPQKPFHLLETGAGLGVFALNFLKAFEAICQMQATLYFEHLTYWVTDLAVDSLQYAASHSLFKEYQQLGRVRFGALNILEPQLMNDLRGQPILERPSFFMILSHYQHSVLPVNILVHQFGTLYEKQVALDYWLVGHATEHPTAEEANGILQPLLANLARFDFSGTDNPLLVTLQQAIQAVLAQWQQPDFWERWNPEADLKAAMTTDLLCAWQPVPDETPEMTHQRQLLLEKAIVAPLFNFPAYELNRLEEHHRYHPCEVTHIDPDPIGTQLLQEVMATYPQATLIYPLGSFQALSALKSLLNPQGFMVITDKGYYGPECMQGVHEEEETLHGNTLSHSVNFPLLERYWQLMGGGAQRTHDETYPVHTLLLTAQAEIGLALQDTFAQLFVDENRNLDGHADLEAGQMFMQHNELSQAIRYYLRALKYRPTDATVLYLLSVSLLNRSYFSRALTFLEQPHDDYFEVYNFAVLKAEAYRSLEQYDKAIPCYEAALRLYGSSAATYYNLGLCWQLLEQPAKAIVAFKAAAMCDPSDRDIQEALAELQAQS